MTITNKPNDGEPLVEKRTDPLGNIEWVATPVFARFLEELTDTSNSNESNLSGDFEANLSSQISELRNRIGSGIPVTIDTTGFTVDTTEQTTDQTEA